MKVYFGVDLGSTATKAVLMGEDGRTLGRGMANSRADYAVAAAAARADALANARLALFRRESPNLADALERHAKRALFADQLDALAQEARILAPSPDVTDAAAAIFKDIRDTGGDGRSDFFRDKAGAAFMRRAERAKAPLDALLALHDKAMARVEGRAFDDGLDARLRRALDAALAESPDAGAETARAALDRALEAPLEPAGEVGTGYGRATLPFPKESIRSEILCHGLGAHLMFPGVRTVLDIGGQDTKAIQVDAKGIVEGFQMNDRCAAGCGRYLGYIADEMNVGVQELGPLAMESADAVRVNATCTVFAGSEVRDRLALGERREDVLAGLHRAIMLRAMSIVARSGGARDKFVFTGGVANNPAAVRELKTLIREAHGTLAVNVAPASIHAGALGAAEFARRADGGRP